MEGSKELSCRASPIFSSPNVYAPSNGRRESGVFPTLEQRRETGRVEQEEVQWYKQNNRRHQIEFPENRAPDRTTGTEI